MLSHAARRRLARLSPLALLALAGAANAQPLNWTGACGTNWFDVCVVGACGANNLIGNNFGQTNCIFNPPFPTAGNQVFLGSNNVTLNGGNTTVGSLDLQVGGVFTRNGNINFGAGFTNAGTFNMTGGAASTFGPVTSTGTINHDSPVSYFQGMDVINNGLFDLMAGDMQNYSGSNSIVSNGTFRKTTASDATNRVPSTFNGPFEVQQGRLFQLFGSAHFTNTSLVSVWPGAECYFRNVTLTGRLAGPNNGFLGMDTTWSVGSGGLTLALTNNGVQWAGGDGYLNGNTLINAADGQLNITGGARSILNGLTDNRGTLNVNADVWYFQSHTLLNSGAINVESGDWQNYSGTNSLVNSGSIVKSTAADWTYRIPTTLGGTLGVQAGGMLWIHSGTTFLPGSNITVSAGASLILRNDSITGDLTAQNQGFLGMDTNNSVVGPLNLNVTGNGFEWAAGDLYFNGNTITTSPTNRLHLLGGARSILNGSMTNSAYMFSNATILYFQSFALTNTGLLEVESGDWQNYSGGNSFTLAPTGIMRKVASANDWTFRVPSSIAGSIQAQGNSLLWTSTSAEFLPSSTASVSPGASLTFRNSALRGKITGANNGFLGNDHACSLGGNLTLAVTGNGYTFAAGDFQHAGYVLTVAPGSLAKVGSSARSELNGTTLNQGTMEVTASPWYFQSHALINDGTLVQHSGDWQNYSGSNSFLNTGTYTKDTASAANQRVPTTNIGTFRVIGGSLQIGAYTQDAGTTVLDGGDIGGNTPMLFNGGTLTGHGNLPPVTNAGGSIFITGAGGAAVSNLGLSGRFIQQAGGTLNIDVASAISFDTISSNGAPSVDGTLNVNILGGFDPKGKVLTIITGTQPAIGAFPGKQVHVTGYDGIARAGASGNNVVLYFPCSFADIADDQGNTPPRSGIPNTGVNEGDYNAFFQGFFDANPACDIADDQGNPIPPGADQVPNSGVNEGDFNLFFQVFFGGC